MKRMLHIKDPCGADWGAMTGDAERRFCGHCQKHVVALAELTPSEAERLVASATPGSLCLRIEHDDEGAVVLRDEAPSDAPLPPPARPRSLLRVAVGASLLVAACRSDPPPPPEASPDLAARSQPSSALAPAPLASASPSTAPPSLPLSAAPAPSARATTEATAEAMGAAPSRPVAAPEASACDPKSGKATKTVKGSKVTMGCVCAPGDTLCSCL